MKNFLSKILLTAIIFQQNLYAATSTEKAKVVLEEIKYIDDTKKITIPVKVEAKIQSLVSSQIEGNITRITKNLGQFVKAGTPILYIENKDPNYNYAEVPVLSPISGVISQIYVGIMEKVQSNQKLIEVINPNSLKLTAEISSNDLTSIKNGLTGEFILGDKKYPIKISGIAPLVNSRTGTAPAELEFLNLKNLPPIGSIGKVKFELKLGKILLIPDSSIVFQDGKSFVRTLKGKNQFEKKLIELGEQRENTYLIKKGIQTGEKVIIRSSRPLKENDLIEI